MHRRVPSLDLIRCLAFFLVVIYHSGLYNGLSSYPQTGVYMFFADVLRWLSVGCIGLFVMLTGYLRVDKKLAPSYFGGLIAVLAGYIAVSVISIPIRHFLLGEVNPLEEWIRRFLVFKGSYYGWYVNMYIGLMVFSPFINLAMQQIRSRKTVILLCAAAVFVTSFRGIKIFPFSPDYWKIAYPLTYYLLGAAVKKLQPRPRTFLCLSGAVLVAVVLASLCIVSTDGGLGTAGGIDLGLLTVPYAAAWEFGDFPIVLLALFLFLGLYRLNAGDKAAAVFRWLSDGCFEGYLLSNLLDSHLYKQVSFWFTPSKLWLTYLCVSVPIFLLSCAAGHYLHRLVLFAVSPLTKRLAAMDAGKREQQTKNDQP